MKESKNFMERNDSEDWANNLKKEEIEAIETGLKDISKGRIHSNKTARKVSEKHLKND